MVVRLISISIVTVVIDSPLAHVAVVEPADELAGARGIGRAPGLHLAKRHLVSENTAEDY